MFKPTQILLCVLMGLTLALVVPSCATKPSPEELFWNTKFDNQAKAKALIDAGTESFNNLVNEKGQIDPLDVIEEYFQIALKFDPGNEKAEQMLATIQGYRTKQMVDNLSEARRLILKSNRKDEETMSLLAAIDKALLIDPKSEDVIKLKAEATNIRKTFIDDKIMATNLAIEAAGKATKDSVRDDNLIKAWATIQPIMKIAPEEKAARDVYVSLEKQIGSMVDNRLAGVSKLIDSAKFTNAKTQIDSADELNVKLGGTSKATVDAARFSLYSAWAKNLFEKKDYTAAETRANQALAIKKDKSLQAMIQTIAENRKKELSGTHFVSSLAEIDKLISAGNLVDAQTKLNTLVNAVKDADKQDQMDSRRKKIQAAVPELYNQGVQAYRSEKFDIAVQALTTVVAINPGYEQAKDFLEKATQKKKLLDQY